VTLYYFRSADSLLRAAPPRSLPRAMEATGKHLMAEDIRDAAAVRAARDRLLRELDELDRLGERMAAIELNSAVETLNERLGEPTDPVRLADLQRRYFSN